MSRYSFDRRTLLAGLGGGLVPLLAPHGARAASATPKRLVVIAVPNGYTADYLPEVVGTGWQARATEFSPLQPLEPWKDRLLVMGGINVQNGIDTGKDVKKDPNATIAGHAIMPFLLTGAKGVAGPSIPDGWSLTASHCSVDQYVVQKLPAVSGRPFPSLVMRPVALSAGGYGNTPLSYSGKTLDGKSHNAPSIRENPFTVFDDLFGGKIDITALQRQRAKRKSILDFSSRQLKQVQARVGSDDKQRIENHLTAITEIEKQLATMSGACQAPGRADETIWSTSQSNPKMNLVIRTQIDLTVAAMACDLTRVASHSWCSSNNNTIVFPWLADRIASLNDTWTGTETGGSGNNLRNHHTIAHNEGQLKREKNLVDRFFIECFAYFIEKLSKTMDPDGRPMIENTLVLYANMQRTGGGHQTDNLQWFLAGNANGYFKQGRYLPFLSGKTNQMAPTNGLLTAIVNAMGCPPVDSFGDPAYGGEATILRG
ncbi:MAG: DUF1552 domain-containing protein [Deltaproteobacteria bacterium]|nr:DUF1552 domain-containing protein [Deltaproteobacteria bacterium]